MLVGALAVTLGLLWSCYPEFPADVSCARYCEVLEAQCGGQHDDASGCLALCEAGVFYDGDTPNEGLGSYGAETGNLVACRLEHGLQASEAATSDDANDACAVAGVSGGGVCGSRQEVWCKLGDRICGPDSEFLPPEQTFQLAVPWRDGLAACLAAEDVGEQALDSRAISLARARAWSVEENWVQYAGCCQRGGDDSGTCDAP